MVIEFQLEQEKKFRIWNGSKYWYEWGMRHRLSGPAIENPWGIKRWYEQGRYIRSER